MMPNYLKSFAGESKVIYNLTRQILIICLVKCK